MREYRSLLRPAAGLTAYLGLCLLIVGLSLPVMSITRFGEAASYSVFGTIVAVAGEGSYLLAALILLFSVAFPAVKLLATLLIALSLGGIGARLRWRIAATFNRFGKYSMLDVFIIAVLIVVFKLRGLVSANVEPGLYYFVGGLFASFLSSALLLMAMPETGTAADEPGGQAEAAEGGRHRWATLAPFVLTLGASLLLLLAGLGLTALAPPGTVESILVQKRPGVDLKFVSLPDAPDYTLEIKLKDGWSHRTATLGDTPVGNGIVFELPATEIADIREIVLWDDNSLGVSDLRLSVIPDEIIDRVRLQGERTLTGEKMRFELTGPRSPALLLGYAISAAAAAGALIAGALLVLRLARAPAG